MKIKGKMTLDFGSLVVRAFILIIALVLCWHYNGLIFGEIIGYICMTLFLYLTRDDDRFCLRLVMACTLGGVSIVLAGLSGGASVARSLASGVLVPSYLILKKYEQQRQMRQGEK